MENKDYHTSFISSASSAEVFEKIGNISGWWAKHFEGKSHNPGDVFTVHFGENGEKDMFKIQVVAVTPERIVWKVLESKQEWVKNISEWTGTEIVWDVIAENEGARITLTHKGLNAGLECYQICTGAWNYLATESLFNLLQENVGKPA